MKRAPKTLWILLGLLCFAGILKATLPQTSMGTWTAAGNLSQARSNAASVLLSDGRILTIGGDGANAPLQAAEFFGTDGSISAAAAMNYQRSRHFAVVMSDGRVLVGGGNSSGGGTTNSAEIYDPAADTWTKIGAMAEARANATAALLQDGRVVIAGGDNAGAPSNTVEIYDPTSGSFSIAGTMSAGRTKHAMAVLQGGQVLIVGGFDGTTPLASSDVFDPSAGTIAAGPALATARYSATATRLVNGQVAVIGGVGSDGNGGTTDLASIELFDPIGGAFSTASSALATAREAQQAYLLPNNNSVLIVGGTSGGNVAGASELFTPQASASDGNWSYTTTTTGSNVTPRSAATGSVMQQDGLLLAAGGADASSNSLASTELYAFPTVKTDQADYPPGTTVTITGSGFTPGETVNIVLVESPLFDTHGPYAVTADGNGNFVDQSFTTDVHDENIRFFLSVTGSQSGRIAQNTFTDSKPNTVTVGAQQTNPVAPGSSTQYTVTVNFNGNGNSCTSPLSVNSALPTGATAAFNPTSVTSTGGNVNSTLTISTTNATPPGSTNFTVLAANGGGTCQTGTATGNGTLVVVENTTTTLASSLPTSTFGQSITLTATVAKVTGPTTPTNGTVTFLDGATQIGTATLNNGTATLQTATLSAGSHSLTASYAGVTNTFGASTSSAITQTVNKADTTTTVSNASGTANQGSVTLTANVAANSPSTATVSEGTVTFTVKQGATTIGTVTSGTVSGGAASANFSLTGVGAGSYTINATYNPATTSPNFNTSTAASPGTLTVNAAGTTTTVASSANPSVFGQGVTFTATIVPASGTTTPTGTVQFVVDGSNFGAAVNVAACAPSPHACATSISSSTLSVGTHSVVANYSGDSNYSASSSTTLTQTVGKASTSAALVSSVNPAVFGQSVTFTATVTVSAPGSGTVPDGENVTFKDGGTTLGTGLTSAGVATFTSSTLTVTTHSITAVYASDTNFLGSTSNVGSQVVGKAATTTTITNAAALTAATVVGQAYTVNFSVTINAPGSGTIPGTDNVTVSDGTASCTATVTAGSCSLTSTTPGAKTISASYAGDTNFSASTSTGAPHTVNKADTTTTITSNTPNPSTVGQAVTMNYTVAVNAPGTGTPSGNVTISDGLGDSCTGTVAAGTCQITFNGAGTKTLTAIYAGDTNFNISTSSSVSQTVNPKLAFATNAFTTLIGLCSPQISVQLQNANGTAATLTTPTTLNLSSNSPGGAFFSDSACSSPVTTAVIAANASTASFFYKDTVIGNSTLTGAATGFTSINQSEGFTNLRFGSTAFSVAINQCSPAISLQSANAQTGNPTSLTQNTVINLSSTSANGKFYNDAACTTQITTTTIGPSIDAGHDSPNFFYKDLSAGSPILTGSAGTASAQQTETITKATPTFTNLTASQAIPFGTASINLSGTISATGSLFPPNGETVNITINGVTTPATIGANGAFSASVDTHAIPASTTPYTITYAYAGDANFNSAANTATTLTVNKRSTSTTISPLSATAAVGQGAIFTVTVTDTDNGPASTPAGTVQVASSNVGDSISSCTLAQTVTGTATCNVTVTPVQPTGVHTISASYTANDNIHTNSSTTINAALTVNNPTTTTSVIGAPNPSTFSQLVTFTATVTSQAGTPTGSVTLFDGGVCGTNPLSGSLSLDANGQASFGTSALNAGMHTIIACYTHTGIFLDSNGSVGQQVNPAGTTTSISAPTMTFGTGGTVTVSVTSMAGTPSGSVMLSVDGGTAATKALSSGSATFTGSDIPALVEPTAASHTLSASYAAQGNFAGSSQTGTLTVNQATPSITWANPADITYGTPLSATQLNATASVPGTFVYSPAAGTILKAGQGQTLTTHFTPNDTQDFTTADLAVTINVNQASPTIVWKNPADITFGTALGNTQLNAIALPPSTALTAWFKGEGDATDSVAGNNGTVQGGTTFAPGQVGQTFSFPDASGDGVVVPYSSGYDLNAPGFAAGFWVQGSQNANGVETILEKSFDGSTGWDFEVNSSTGFSQFDIGEGSGNSAKVTSNVNILDGKFHYITGTWDGGTKMTLYVDGVSQGTATLTSAAANNQGGLNIGFSANGGNPNQYFTGLVDEVQIFDLPLPSGTYSYTPAAGTVLNAGPDQTLSVSFMPDDATDLTTANAGVTINVLKATANITVTPYSVKYDGNPHAATGTAKGVNGEGLTGLDLSGTTHTNAGEYTDPWTFTDSTGNYSDASGTVNDEIKKADAAIKVTPYSVTYDGDPHTAMGSATGVLGETLSGLDLSGTTHTNAGNYTDSWTFTDSTGNYNNASGTVQDCIKKANANVSVTGYSVTYDGNPHTATGSATGVKGETLSGLDLSGTTHTNAGDYPTDPWTFTDVTGNYNSSNGTVHDHIDKANATVNVTPYSVTYDGNPHTATGSATGVKNETLSGLDLSGTTHTNAGDYPSDPWTFTDSTGNYNNSNGVVHDHIDKADAVITVTGYSVTYDGNPHTATGTAKGVKGEYLAGLNLSGTTHTNAGDYPTDPWTFTDVTGNYNNTNGTVHDHIDKANATVNVTPYSVTYDGNPHTATGSATGVKNESLSGLDLSGTTRINAGTYTDSWTFTDVTGNYNNASGTVSDVISQAMANIMVNGFTGMYDGNPHGATGTAKGVESTPVDLSALLNLGASFTNVPGGTANWTFAGNTNYKPASGSVQIIITQASSTTTVMFEAGPYTYRGTPFTATAVATGVGGLSQAVMVVYSGDCTNVSAAGCNASASFAGDLNHTGSIGSASIVISPANTSTTVSSSPNPSNWMDVVTLAATVTNTSNGAGLSGSVNFYANPGQSTCSTLQGGNTALGTGALSFNGTTYTAMISTPKLAVGNDTILACYNNFNSGDPNYNANFVGGTGTTSQTVIPAPIATLTPASLSFGNQAAGTTSAAQSVTLCNGPSGATNSPCYNATVATAPLLVSSIGFSGNNANDFIFTTSVPNSCNGNTNTGVPVGGSCTINVQFAPQSGTAGTATALLNVADNSGNVSGSIQSTSLVGAGVSTISSLGSLSTDAIFATANGCNSVTISGNGTVDSFDGATNMGNVGTNGNVSMNGNPVINGTVYSPFGGTGSCGSKTMTGLSTSGKAVATGGLKVSAPMTYPLPAPPSPAPPTTNQSISGSCGTLTGCANNGSKNVNVAPGQYGNLTVSGGTTVHITAGTYNLNSLTLSGNSILYVDSGPVVVNFGGASLAANSSVMDLSGGSIVNPSGKTSNLQFYYAGSSAIKLSGGSGSYALVYAPNSPVNVSGGSHFYGSIVASTVNSSGNTAIHGDAGLTAINGGSSLWFSSAGLKVQLPSGSGTVKLYVTNAQINFTANGQAYTVPVPNSVITFSSTGTSSSTTWDATNNRWSTLVPISSISGNATIHTFFDGVAFPVPAGGFPNGIQNVTWQAAYSTSTTGLSFNWQWGAAVYSSLPASGATGNYSGFGVNPLDNSDPAGTPENYKGNLVFGDMGPGYIGMYVGSTGVVPTIAPASASPSSLNFGVVPVNTQSSVMTSTLTNNQSGTTLTIGGITITGTNVPEFTLLTGNQQAGVTNCMSAPNQAISSLAPGASCTVYATLTPAAVGKRSAKIAFTDSANNSPQTVYLTGTGQ